MSDYHTLLPIISAWLAHGKAVAMATVLQTWHSAPRQAGAKLFVSDAGNIAGSVSGGCVEAAVIETALQVIKSGEAQTLHFGVADDTALNVGLACGGEIAIHVEVYEETLHEHIQQQIAQHTPFGIWTQLTTSQHILVQDNHVVYSSQNQLFNMASTCDETTYNAEKGWFYERVQAPFRLVIVGGNHISMALAQSVILLKWHIILIDPRTAFANQARFPDAHQIINTYPQKALSTLHLDKSCAVVVLSHDPKLDDPALISALNTDVGYIGALGSRRTQQARNQRLQQQGYSDEDIKRIHGPIGLEIGATTPEEISIAIVAQIIQYQRQHTNRITRIQKPLCK